MSTIKNPESLIIPAGTLVHICGWPVEITSDTEIVSDPANIELVRRDLYLRRSGELPVSEGAVDPQTEIVRGNNPTGLSAQPHHGHQASD